jgi:hypothetical protein
MEGMSFPLEHFDGFALPLRELSHGLSQGLRVTVCVTGYIRSIFRKGYRQLVDHNLVDRSPHVATSAIRQSISCNGQ